MTYTVYVIPTRGGARLQVGSYETMDGQSAIEQAEQELIRLNTHVPEGACWWAEWSSAEFGELAYPKPGTL